jgi:hypothetical protein
VGEEAEGVESGEEGVEGKVGEMVEVAKSIIAWDFLSGSPNIQKHGNEFGSVVRGLGA